MPFDHPDITTFDVCLSCAGLRGGRPREHRCACQARTPDWKRQWQGRDMARDLDLCVLCVRGTVTTWSKWSWLACDLCRQVSERVGRWYGARSALPLGRHSIMNGQLVRLPGVGDADVRAAGDALMSAGRGWESLRGWQRAEFARLAAPLRGSGGTVALTAWQLRWPPTLGASVDAFDRYGVVPVPAALTDLRAAQQAFRTSVP